MVRDRPTADASGGEMAQISIDDLDEVELMLTELEISKGNGNLVICIVASPAYRAKIIQLIQDRFSCKITQIDDGDTLIYDLKGKKPEGVDVSLWIFPESLPNDIIEALNNFREFFYQAGIPSIVFLSPSALHQVISLAPDFWRYRGGFHLLKGDDKGPGYQAVEALSTPLSMSYQSKEELLSRKRINEYLLEKIKDKKVRGKILLELGNIYLLLSDEQKSIEYFDHALTISRETGDRSSEGKYLGNLGLAYIRLGEARKAIEFCKQSLKISHDLGDKLGEGNRLGNLGLAYFNLGEINKAIEFFEQALAISRQIGDRRGEGTRLGNLGLAYIDLGQTIKAIVYLEQALAISREIKDKRREGAALGNLGLAYIRLSEMHKAIEYLEKALAISHEIGDRRFEGSAYGDLGNVYAAIGELHKAIDHYMQGLVISHEIGDRKGEGNHMFNLSIALNELGQREKATSCAKSALAIFEEIESPNAEDVRKTLAEWKAADTSK